MNISLPDELRDFVVGGGFAARRTGTCHLLQEAPQSVASGTSDRPPVMLAKPIVPRELANLDVDEAIAYYLSEASDQVALGFVDALERHTGSSAGTRSAGRRAMASS